MTKKKRSEFRQLNGNIEGNRMPFFGSKSSLFSWQTKSPNFPPSGGRLTTIFSPSPCARCSISRFPVKNFYFLAGHLAFVVGRQFDSSVGLRHLFGRPPFLSYSATFQIVSLLFISWPRIEMFQSDRISLLKWTSESKILKDSTSKSQRIFEILRPGILESQRILKNPKESLPLVRDS